MKQKRKLLADLIVQHGVGIPENIKEEALCQAAVAATKALPKYLSDPHAVMVINADYCLRDIDKNKLFEPIKATIPASPLWIESTMSNYGE